MRKTEHPPKQMERPVLFKGEMVRAILDGRKTQTRRIVKDEWLSPKRNLLGLFDFLGGGGTCDSSGEDGLRVSFVRNYDRRDDNGRHYKYTGLLVQSESVPEDGAEEIPGRYGHQGDRLWVRETFAMADKGTEVLSYKADETRERCKLWKYRPSIHMPRWASRIMLEITGIRVERLQEISEDDAKAEGITLGDDSLLFSPQGEHSCVWARGSYANLWDAINGRGAWEKNPWVWVISFCRVGNENQPTPLLNPKSSAASLSARPVSDGAEFRNTESRIKQATISTQK